MPRTKLTLSKETLAELTSAELSAVNGAGRGDSDSCSCTILVLCVGHIDPHAPRPTENFEIALVC